MPAHLERYFVMGCLPTDGSNCRLGAVTSEHRRFLGNSFEVVIATPVSPKWKILFFLTDDCLTGGSAQMFFAFSHVFALQLIHVNESLPMVRVAWVTRSSTDPAPFEQTVGTRRRVRIRPLSKWAELK